MHSTRYHSPTLAIDRSWRRPQLTTCQYGIRVPHFGLTSTARVSNEKAGRHAVTKRLDALCLARAKFCRALIDAASIYLNLSCKQIPSSPKFAVVCRCQTLAHLLCLSARHSTARVLSVSISSSLAHLLFPTIIRMMTTITIMSSFPNRFDHDEDYLFGQPSLAACILASKFLSDTTLKSTLFHIYFCTTLC
jgi:hypothetical protein